MMSNLMKREQANGNQENKSSYATQKEKGIVLLSFNFNVSQPFISQNKCFSSDLQQMSEQKRRKSIETVQLANNPHLQHRIPAPQASHTRAGTGLQQLAHSRGTALLWIQKVKSTASSQTPTHRKAEVCNDVATCDI